MQRQDLNLLCLPIPPHGPLETLTQSRYRAGQVFIEPQDVPMQAFNVAEGPTRMMVVSIGAEGQPTGQPAMPVSE